MICMPRLLRRHLAPPHAEDPLVMRFVASQLKDPAQLEDPRLCVAADHHFQRQGRHGRHIHVTFARPPSPSPSLDAAARSVPRWRRNQCWPVADNGRHLDQDDPGCGGSVRAAPGDLLDLGVDVDGKSLAAQRDGGDSGLDELPQQVAVHLQYGVPVG